jgi:methylated-DNA-[protein]-cysteine S-methyltransferase
MPTPFAVLGIRTSDTAVTALDYLPIDQPTHEPTSPVAARAVAAIERYLDDPAYLFDLPLEPVGTPFQQAVWRAIVANRAGDARPYGALARDLESEPRAVGQACGSNPIALVIPCHRVTAAGNRLGGFMHSTGDHALAIKRWLLAHEREVVEPTLF